MTRLPVRVLPPWTRICVLIRSKRLVLETTDILIDNATVFTGLFASLKRTKERKSRAPQKVLNEWCKRIRYEWESSTVSELSDKLLSPVIARADSRECAMWADRLLVAAKNAGIGCRDVGIIVLDDTNVLAYSEWESAELYVGDTVRVLEPSWYQNGAIVEQGYCELIEEGDTL